jgi:hypothetical protein
MLSEMMMMMMMMMMDYQLLGSLRACVGGDFSGICANVI